MQAYQDTFTFVRLLDVDSMRDLFRVMRDTKKLDDLNDACGATVRPESPQVLRNVSR